MVANEAPGRPYILQWRSAVLNSALPSSSKLCLLVLAEFAQADGSSCYPSQPTIGRFGSVNARTALRALDVAEAEGWISCRAFKRTDNKQGWNATEYTLLLPDRADTVPIRIRAAGIGRGDTESAPVEQSHGLSVPVVLTLKDVATDTVSIEQALSNQSNKPRAARRARRTELTFDQFTEAEPQPSPSAASIDSYLDKVGVPHSIGSLFYLWAGNKWSGKDKKYRDWSSVLLRALREDWHRLWRFGDGGRCYLTTAGEMLDRETQEDP